MNMLDSKVEIVMTMSDEAFEWLPTITTEDLSMRWERYRLFLGKWEIVTPRKVLVRVEATVEIPDDPDYYTEGVDTVHVNLAAIRGLVASLREHLPIYQGLELVGEIHFHTVLQGELGENERPWYLASGDKTALIDTYERGVLDSNKPFLIGVAGLTEELKTGYAFYRLVKEGTEYFIRSVGWE